MTNTDGLGRKIKELRTARKLTQKQVGKKLKVTESTISMYEKGTRKPSYDVIREMAAIFDVKMSYILEEDEPDKFYFDREGLSDEDIEYIKETIALVKRRASLRED